MAYTFFPESVAQINKKLRVDKAKVNDIITVFNLLKKQYKSVKAPINIDPQKLKVVNVARALQGQTDINKIKNQSKVRNISLKFGNGSMGGRGVQNKGNLFENQFATDIENYHAGEQLKDSTSQNTIADLYKMYNLKKYPDLTVATVGELNVKRPLTFGSNIEILAQGQKGYDVGPIVTDITLFATKQKTKPVAYLSLKYAGTTTFFNVGVKTILTKEEIKKRTITINNGKRLLDMLGINHQKFCDVFNGKGKGEVVNVWSKMSGTNKNQLERLLISGIGFGYHVIHKMSGTIKSFQIDEKYMKAAGKPLSCRVFYGGKTGTGKRVDVEIKTAKYEFKLNIRDTQGTDGYPTRLMGDFKYI